jgi:ATP-dependent DNA helicase RecG
MRNGKGGRVIFGIQPDGSVVGQEVSDKTVEQVVAELQRIQPAADFSVERIPLQGGAKEAIAVSVHRGAQRPYTYKGTAYKRLGNVTTAMSQAEYNRMLLEAHHASERWENAPADGWRVSDLDGDEIVRTVEEAIRRGRLGDPGTRDLGDLLRGLGLLTDGALTRAAVVLFARAERVMPTFPQCRVRLARFKGVDKTEFIDNRQYEGNAFDLLVRADRFVRDHLPVAGRVVGGIFERSDDPIYPPEALREALANAFCHRDYSIGGGSVSIAIFDDRLEISSAGGLHFGLTVEDLYRPHDSLPWNPIVASVFFKRGIIETWGRGTLKMTQLTTEVGLPRPEFEELAGALVVRFRPSRYLPPQRIGRDLTVQQQAILGALATRGSMALGRIQDVLGTKERRGVQTDLHFLRSLDLVVGEGHGRGARWRLKDQPR